jgi:hypothetical protein
MKLNIESGPLPFASDPGEGFSGPALEKIGMKAAEMILRRTAKGMDYLGNRFVKYSPEYARYRAKNNRQVDLVDLNFYGRMYASLTHDAISENEVVLYFAGGDQAVKAKSLNKKRLFFSLSVDELNVLAEIVGAQWVEYATK